jgi:hypothetical protein
MSRWIEYLLLRAFAEKRKEQGAISLWSLTWKANLLSYSFLVALLIGIMVAPWL